MGEQKTMKKVLIVISVALSMVLIFVLIARESEQNKRIVKSERVMKELGIGEQSGGFEYNVTLAQASADRRNGLTEDTSHLMKKLDGTKEDMEKQLRIAIDDYIVLLQHFEKYEQKPLMRINEEWQKLTSEYMSDVIASIEPLYMFRASENMEYNIKQLKSSALKMRENVNKGIIDSDEDVLKIGIAFAADMLDYIEALGKELGVFNNDNPYGY